MKAKMITAIGISTVALSLSHSTASAQEIGTVTATALNIRSGPGIKYNVKGCLYKGNTVSILEKQNGWMKVQLSNNTTGWVNESYIKEGSQDATENKEEISESEVNKNIKVTCKSNLNVRSGPGISYNREGSLKSGQIVYANSQSSNGWYKIKISNDTYGWISGLYVKETTEEIQETTQEISESEVNKNVKTSANLNIRSGPGTSYIVKGVLKSGETVYAESKSSNGWYKIKLSNNTYGWISGLYAKETTEEDINDSLNDNVTSDEKIEAIINLAMDQLGKPYVWGANGPNSFDCSGFTRYVYLHAAGISLPRVSYDQAKAGTAVSISDLKRGDLLHFATVTPGRTSHVGIYLGNNEFIHASGSQTKPDKVKISSLSGYYRGVLLGARRFN